MKIINTQSGKAYQLSPGTQIEIERSNLFFNEWGEQSLPVDLPDTDTNRALCGYPDMLGNKQRPRADIECSIQDGDYYQPARQAILGARRKESITTSFYINEGSFLAKVDDTLLSEVFGDETVPGVETVQQGIDFCRRLANGTSEAADRFAIFPVVADKEGGTDESGRMKSAYYLNRYGRMVDGWWEDIFFKPTEELDFYNATDRIEYDGDKSIHVPAGFYMSPFIKANYLLERIFRYFGYELQENFFTRTIPFKDMVFVNNCLDALVNGKIRMADLLPDCTCAVILNVFRKKFCCEFITDEAKRTVTILLFNEIADEEDNVPDLTPYLSGHPKMEVPEEYKQISICSEDSVEINYMPVENPDTLEEMRRKYQAVYYLPAINMYERLFARIYWDSVEETYRGHISGEYVTNGTYAYKEGTELPYHEVQVPDKQIDFVRSDSNTDPATGNRWIGSSFLYIGEGKFKNSSLKNEETGETDEKDGSENKECKPMLAFSYFRYGYSEGTVYSSGRNVNLYEERLWDYSLGYVGPEGIFEKFYRKMDNLYRNSLLEVNADLLLPNYIKQQLSPHRPVTLKGQRLLPNVLRYTIGGKEEDPTESSFLTMRHYDPASYAKPSEKLHYNEFEYQWKTRVTIRNVSNEEYLAIPLKNVNEARIYLDKYPQEKYADGKVYYSIDVARKIGPSLFGYRLEVVCEKRS